MRQMGQLEAEVMQRLWFWNRPVLVREVLEDLQKGRDIAYTTVMTVLDNLHRKGLASRAKDGRAYRYSPTCSREVYAASLLEEVLAGSGGDRGAVLLHFVEQMPVADATALRAALDGAAHSAANGAAPDRGRRGRRP
ncbi:MAG: BlaI/MecI/CopY family transcriptional regulator [Actinomycetota bacterium]|nr:BlaI/MecI/CopY family transcriptional regulator [Actinomycetota bacterium]